MMGQTESQNEFTRLDLYSKIFQPPAVKFKDLKAVVVSRLSSNLLPFEARTDFIRVTNETVLTPITIQIVNSDLQFQNKDGVMHGVMDIFGEMTSLGGHIVNTLRRAWSWMYPNTNSNGITKATNPFISTPYRSTPPVTS